MDLQPAGAVGAHVEAVTHKYLVHYPAHGARPQDPHYVDFNAYHRKTRSSARCYVGTRIGFESCKDENGSQALPAANGWQPGLELHHAHIEFSLTNGISLTALEQDYPGISNPEEVGAWVESEANFRWLCVHHHRGSAGAHSVAHSDWEGAQYVQGLIS